MFEEELNRIFVKSKQSYDNSTDEERKKSEEKAIFIVDRFIYNLKKKIGNQEDVDKLYTDLAQDLSEFEAGIVASAISNLIEKIRKPPNFSGEFGFFTQRKHIEKALKKTGAFSDREMEYIDDILYRPLVNEYIDPLFKELSRELCAMNAEDASKALQSFSNRMVMARIGVDYFIETDNIQLLFKYREKIIEGMAYFGEFSSDEMKQIIKKGFQSSQSYLIPSYSDFLDFPRYLADRCATLLKKAAEDGFSSAWLETIQFDYAHGLAALKPEKAEESLHCFIERLLEMRTLEWAGQRPFQDRGIHLDRVREAMAEYSESPQRKTDIKPSVSPDLQVLEPKSGVANHFPWDQETLDREFRQMLMSLAPKGMEEVQSGIFRMMDAAAPPGPLCDHLQDTNAFKQKLKLLKALDEVGIFTRRDIERIVAEMNRHEKVRSEWSSDRQTDAEFIDPPIYLANRCAFLIKEYVAPQESAGVGIMPKPNPSQFINVYEAYRQALNSLTPIQAEKSMTQFLRHLEKMNEWQWNPHFTVWIEKRLLSHQSGFLAPEQEPYDSAMIL